MVNFYVLRTFIYFYKNTNFVGIVMQKLNLPEYSFRYKTDEGKTYIFDSFRKKFVRLTPEEWVRQNFARYLVAEKNFSLTLIAVESAVVVNQNTLRADMIVFNRTGNPLLVAEFKAPDVKISQLTFDQVVRYNMQLKVPFIIVSNGIDHYCCRINYDDNSYVFLIEIPDFGSIIQGS